MSAGERESRPADDRTAHSRIALDDDTVTIARPTGAAAVIGPRRVSMAPVTVLHRPRRIGPFPWPCSEHGADLECCPRHGCPGCVHGDGMRGECPVCDAAMRARYPRPECKVGDDCLVCDAFDCSNCNCTRPVCRHCRRCDEHASFEATISYDLEGYRTATAECEHSWWDPAAQSWTGA